MRIALFVKSFIFLGLLSAASVTYAQDESSEIEISEEASGSGAGDSAGDESSAASSEDASNEPVENTSEASEGSSPAESSASSAPAASGLSQGQQQAAPVPKPRTAKRTAVKSVKDKVYSKPLYFDQINNGIKLTDPELVYDLATSKGQALQLGDVELSEKTFFVALVGLDKAHPQMKRIADSLPKSPALVLKYPHKMINSGTFEMLSRTGDVLWSTVITEENREAWELRIEDWREELKKLGAPAAQVRKAGLFSTQYAVEDFPVEILPKAGSIFKFCLSSKSEKGSARLCSQWYGSRRKGSSVQIALARVDPIEPRVLVFNKAANLKATVPIQPNEPVNFFAELRKGQSYEFIAMPSQLDITDFAETSRSQILRLVGFNVQPTQRLILLNPEEVRSFRNKIGFEETIGDFRKFWATAVKRDNPQLFFPGQGGGIFRHRFILNVVPREAVRPYLRNDSPVVTYSTRPVVYGKVAKGVTLQTKQSEVKMDSADKSLFAWTLEAPKRGQMNRSYLNVKFEGEEYRTYTDIFRSYSNELSGRFSGLATAAGFLLMGEVAYNKWFESLFGWDNYYVSRLRWGISTKYFQTFTPLQVDSNGTKANISVLTVDLKYRATPGVWGREETLGAILSYQDLNFGDIKAPMLGVGAFWARSMPKVFDRLFNYLPFMEYPKFVDMEFIYYASSTNPDVKLQGNFALNFHGKVHWTDTIFGEAGFGMKRYAVQDLALAQQAALNTFYGTVGLGINF